MRPPQLLIPISVSRALHIFSYFEGRCLLDINITLDSTNYDISLTSYYPSSHSLTNLWIILRIRHFQTTFPIAIPSVDAMIVLIAFGTATFVFVLLQCIISTCTRQSHGRGPYLKVQSAGGVGMSMLQIIILSNSWIIFVHYRSLSWVIQRYCS